MKSRRTTRLTEVREKLKVHDRRHGLTDKAKSMAEKRKRTTDHLRDDFGRNLPYYAPIVEALERHVGTLRGKRGIHVASSFGILPRYLQSRGVEAVSFDLSRDASKIAARLGNRKVIRGNVKDLHRYGFKEGSLDFFVSDNFLLSFFSDNQKISNSPTNTLSLALLSHFLKPKGIGVIKYAIFPEWKSWFLGREFEHIPEIFSEMVKALDFEVVEINKKSRLVVLRKK